MKALRNFLADVKLRLAEPGRRADEPVTDAADQRQTDQAHDAEKIAPGGISFLFCHVTGWEKLFFCRRDDVHFNFRSLRQGGGLDAGAGGFVTAEKGFVNRVHAPEVAQVRQINGCLDYVGAA